MWSSRLFWKLFLTYAILNTVAACGIAFIASAWYEGSVEYTPPTAAAESPSTVGSPSQIPNVEWAIWGSAGLACLLLLGVTYWTVARIVRPVITLTDAAQALASGDYATPVYVNNRDELGNLARSFHEMRMKMESREGQLRDTNQRLSTILGGMTDGVIAVDQTQQVLFANRAAGELMGFSPEKAQGRLLLETVRRHALRDVVVELLATPGEGQFELEFSDASRDLTLAVSATSLPDQAGVVLVFHNLTERRRLEAMRRNFVANVSHELKTPLSSIKAYAETLSNGAMEDPQHRGKFVHQIEEQADRLHQLILDLLSLSRIESGQELLEIRPVLLHQVAYSCLQDYRRAAEAKQIELRMDAIHPNAKVHADDDGLRQILDNLIDNAIKYTPAGGRVTIGWQPDGKVVLISVADTGIGIPTELQTRVFERFFRVDKARSRELGGTGLGLAIVKHLTQSFGGTVEVHSRPEQGSRFTIRLPAG